MTRASSEGLEMSTFCTKIETQNIHPEARTDTRCALSAFLTAEGIWAHILTPGSPGCRTADPSLS